ncbi:MAG: hypothetical protein COT85_04990 [Chlamydiae bacterium CG10_big_fil_rev_8_21_14_0_10_42_34]|nr:MAG: hypothetical protein COT85_04990 [Chlamydiae bacterium CG10_big_fil_rev_8_21_14_0_10_42_34]
MALDKTITSLLITTQLLFAQDHCASKLTCSPKIAQNCNEDSSQSTQEPPLLITGYNYPACPQIRYSWNLYLDASFIYWQPVQENMEIVFSSKTPPPILNGMMVNMDFDYKPGFKLGIGSYFDYDHWDLYAEYTWFHCNQNQSVKVLPNGELYSIWQHPTAQSYLTNDHENWNLKIDIGDLDLGRWGYVGKNFIIRPFFGTRAAWIRQNAKIISTLGPTFVSSVVTVKYHSWGLGAKTGVDTEWKIASGFKALGRAEADLLVTNYSGLSFDSILPFSPVDNIKIKQKNITVVKPHLDLQLGLGWSTYLDCNNWHLDFSATYEFQVFFNQNMFRHFQDHVMTGNSRLPNGNLYIQGLNLSTKLDF